MKRIIFLLILSSLFYTASCSGNGVRSPILSDNLKSGDITNELQTAPVYVSDYDSNGNPYAGLGVLGIFSGYIDPVNLTGEITTLKTAALTDTLEIVDITNFMNMFPCTDCLKLKSISMDADGHPVATIGIKHPFDVGDPLKPITGRNRADLHVFNVEGIVVLNGSGVAEFPSLGSKIATDGLVNSDGYCGYLDPYLDEILLTESTLHPYKLHFDDYTIGNFDPLNPMGFESVTIPPPSGNLVMAMGCDYDYKDYVFDIEDGSRIDFIMAVGCTYAVSAASKSLRFQPEYRIPQHNKKAASEVWVEIVSNDLRDGDTSSTAELNVFVLDMNHGATVGGALNEMAFDSSVSDILIEIPGVTTGAVSNYVAMGGDGRDPLNPLVFNSTITNTEGGGMGDYFGLVKVLDSYPTGQNSSPLLNGHDGIKRVDPYANPLTGTFAISEFAAYAVFPISVSQGIPEDPIAIINTIPDPPEVPKNRPLVQFDGSASYDPDGGSITLFEWDFDWDGIPANFVPDVSDSNPTTEYIYSCIPDSYTAALRVTDDDTPAGVSAIASVEVTVTDDIDPGTWTDPVELGHETFGGDFLYCTGQALTMESNGLVHIITREYTIPPLSTYYVCHRTFDGTTLSSKEIVPGAPAYPNSVSMVSSAIDGNDELHVIWRTGYLAGMKIQHTVTQNGSFTGVVNDLRVNNLSNYLMEMVNIQSNSDGDIMVTWLYHDQDFTDVHFEYTLDEGSGFSPAAQIPYFIHLRTSTNPSPSYINVSPELVSTPDNKFHQVYYAKDADLSPNIINWHLVFNGTSWESPRVAIDFAGYQAMWDQAACVGPNGDIYVTGQLSANNMGFIRYDAASDTWMGYKKAATNSNLAAPYGAVEVDRYGMVHMAYKTNIGLPYENGWLHMRIFCRLADETSILAIPDYPIDDTTTNNQQCYTDLMWDKNGNLLVLYQDSRNVMTYDPGTGQYYLIAKTYFRRLMYE